MTGRPRGPPRGPPRSGRASPTRPTRPLASRDGPDEMGRDLAEGPCRRRRRPGRRSSSPGPSSRALLDQVRRTVLVGTGASWPSPGRPRRCGGSATVRRGGTAASWSGSRPRCSATPTARAFLPTDLVVVISQSGSSPGDGGGGPSGGRDRLPGGRGQRGRTLPRCCEVAGLCRCHAERPRRGRCHEVRVRPLPSCWRSPAPSPPTSPPGPPGWRAAGRRGRLAGRHVARAAARRRRPPVDLGLGTAAGLTASGGLLWHEKAHRPAVATRSRSFAMGRWSRAPGGRGPASRRGSARHGADRVPRPLARRARPARRPPRDGGARRAHGTTRYPPLAWRRRARWRCEALLRLQQLARATAHAAGTYQDGFRILRGDRSCCPVIRLKSAAVPATPRSLRLLRRPPVDGQASVACRLADEEMRTTTMNAPVRSVSHREGTKRLADASTIRLPPLLPLLSRCSRQRGAPTRQPDDGRAPARGPASVEAVTTNSSSGRRAQPTP